MYKIIIFSFFNKVRIFLKGIVKIFFIFKFIISPKVFYFFKIINYFYISKILLLFIMVFNPTLFFSSNSIFIFSFSLHFFMLSFISIISLILFSIFTQSLINWHKFLSLYSLSNIFFFQMII